MYQLKQKGESSGGDIERIAWKYSMKTSKRESAIAPRNACATDLDFAPFSALVVTTSIPAAAF